MTRMYRTERSGIRFLTLKQPHDDMRIGLCDLWLQQGGCELPPLQRTILKLTSELCLCLACLQQCVCDAGEVQGAAAWPTDFLDVPCTGAK